MGQIIAKYGTLKGAKIEYKDSLTWAEFAGITKLTTVSKDATLANNELIKLAVTKITMPDGKEHTNAIEVFNLINAGDARDGMRLLKALASLIQDGEDGDPKGGESD